MTVKRAPPTLGVQPCATVAAELTVLSWPGPAVHWLYFGLPVSYDR